MGLNRIALLVASIAAVGCTSATPRPHEPQPRTAHAAPAELPPSPETAPAPAPPPTVEVPPPAPGHTSAPPDAAPAVPAESPPAPVQPLPARDTVNGTAIISNVSVSGAAVPTAARVVAAMRAGFRGCYQRSLQQNPKSQGQIRLTIEVQPDGAVQSVTSAPSGILLEAAVACVTARARVGQFTATDGGNATVVATVTFVPPSPGARTRAVQNATTGSAETTDPAGAYRTSEGAR